MEKKSIKYKMITPILASKRRPPSLDRLLQIVASHEKEREMCALCLCEEDLLSMSHSLTLRTQSDRSVDVFELVQELNLTAVCGTLESHKLCSTCVGQMHSYYEFTRRVLTTSSALKKILKVVKKSRKQGTSLPKRKKRTLKLSYKDIMQYADFGDIKSENKDRLNCAETIREINQECVKVNSENSHSCNIFGDHLSTINDLKQCHNGANFTAKDVKDSAEIFQCKCGLRNMSLEELTIHGKVHMCDDVLLKILKNKLYCRCCLKEKDDLVDVSIISIFNGQTSEQLSLDNMLCEIFNTKEINSLKRTYICDECIEKAISAHSFRAMYQQSTECLQNCLTQFENCLNAALEEKRPCDRKINMRVSFDLKSVLNKTIKSDTDSIFDWTADDNFNCAPEKSVFMKTNKKNYECTKCEMDFTAKTSYMEHRRNHLRKEPHSCRVCEKKFRALVPFLEHKRAHEENVRCIVCRLTLPRFEINTHMEKYHSEQKLICDECEQCFYRKNALTKHIFTQHMSFSKNGDLKNCQLCHTVFKTHRRFMTHRCRYMCTDCYHYPCIHETYLRAFQNEEIADPKSLHKCTDCDFTYGSMWRLLEHVNQEHLSVFPHLCITCGEQFPSKRALSKHSSSEHPKILCPLCRNTCRSAAELERHLEECKTLEKPFKCENCEACFASEFKLAEHLEKHYPNKFQCSACKLSFRSQQKLDTHLYTVHKIGSSPQTKQHSKYQCSMCISEFASSKERLEHEMTHPPDAEHICHICSKTFATRMERYEHLRNHKPHLDKPCEVCGRMFDKNTLQKHMKVHVKGDTVFKKENMEKLKSHMCDICGVLKGTRQALNRHKEFHKTQQKCPHCFKLISENSFEKHLSLHETRNDGVLKVYVVKGKVKKFFRKKLHCDKCNYSTIFERCYEAHLNKHLNIKPYVCKICSKAFHNKITHMQHVKTHEGLKPELCQQCGKHFGSKKALVFHTRLHTGERPFVCEYCKLSFITANRMREHQIRNHFKPQYPCTVCNKMFYAERYVRKHVKEVHLGQKRIRARAKKKDEVS